MWVQSSDADIMNGVLRFQKMAAQAGYQYCMTGPIMDHDLSWARSTLGPLNQKWMSALPINSIGEPFAVLNLLTLLLSIGSIFKPGQVVSSAWIDIKKGIGTHAPESSSTGHRSMDQTHWMGVVVGRDQPTSSSLKGIVHQFWIYNIFSCPHQKNHFL